MSTNKGVVLALFWAALGSPVAAAEPSYLVYTSTAAVFRFDAGRYEVLTPADPKFEPGYAIGDQMLWDRTENRVPFEVYRAPNLIGFEPSQNGLNEFVTFSSAFDVVVDGFGTESHTLGSLCLRFWPEPASAPAQITFEGQLLQRWTVSLPALNVVTPVAAGYFADTESAGFSFTGVPIIRVIAFSDKDGDGAFQGVPRFGIVAMSAAVPVAPATWGRVKAIYR